MLMVLTVMAVTSGITNESFLVTILMVIGVVLVLMVVIVVLVLMVMMLVVVMLGGVYQVSPVQCN